MTPEPIFSDDPFVDSLLAATESSGNEPLRDAILKRTAAGLRWRWRMRRIGRVGTVAACFLGGMLTMELMRNPEPPPPIVVVQVPVERPIPDTVAEKSPVRQPSAAEVELEAEKNFVKHESARRFREAGDLYLLAEANHKAALRCYRNFLDEADESDLPVVESDTWLLASLKNARRKEISNANAIN